MVVRRLLHRLFRSLLCEEKITATHVYMGSQSLFLHRNADDYHREVYRHLDPAMYVSESTCRYIDPNHRTYFVHMDDGCVIRLTLQDDIGNRFLALRDEMVRHLTLTGEEIRIPYCFDRYRRIALKYVRKHATSIKKHCGAVWDRDIEMGRKRLVVRLSNGVRVQIPPSFFYML